jgi:hypothetical protein
VSPSSRATRRGTLHWALRRSFTEYVAAMDDGRIDRHGVDLDEEERFVFAPSAESSETVWGFEGRVEFWAHFGVLDFRLHGVRLELGPRPCVTVGVQPRGVGRVVLSDLTDLPSPSPAERVFAAALTEDGVRVLGGVYEVGDALDPLVVVAGALT